MSLKRRIKTVQNTSKITKAMSLVSAGQTNKLKGILSQYQNYTNLMSEIISNIAWIARNRFDEDLEVITLEREITMKASQKFLSLPPVYIQPNLKKDLYIVITSDKGLCGSFNSSLIKFFKEKAGHGSEVMIVGKKGYDLLIRDENYIILDNDYLESNVKYIKNDIVLERLTKKVLGRIAEGYERIFLFYNHFISMLKQEPRMKQIFPISVPAPKEYTNFYRFDSNPMTTLSSLIPHYLHKEIYEVIINNARSETAKRMMAMDQASENSKEMLTDLKLKYNRQRQTKVTRELIEVISGISD